MSWRLALLALAVSTVGCANPTPAVDTCEVLVDTWAAYDARCGFTDGAPHEATDEDRARVEADFFGAEGCEAATIEDFRDPEALRDECPAALEGTSCDATYLPDACADQLLR